MDAFVSSPFSKTKHPVTAVWLCREDNALVVRIEIAGRWITVIRDYASNPSHIVESSGISQAIARPGAI